MLGAILPSLVAQGSPIGRRERGRAQHPLSFGQKLLLRVIDLKGTSEVEVRKKIAEPARMTNVKRGIDASHGAQAAPESNFTAYLIYPFMSLSPSPAVLPPPDTAVLLVLLPLARFGETGPNSRPTKPIGP